MSADPKLISSVVVFRENKLFRKTIIFLVVLVFSFLLLKNVLSVISNLFGSISSGSSTASVVTPLPGSGFCSGKDLVLSPRNPYIEGEQERGCLSALIDLPQLVRFEYYVPGETEVYECKNGGCVRVFTIPDMDGGKNSRQNIRFPRSFRLKGKPGKFWFRLI